MEFQFIKTSAAFNSMDEHKNCKPFMQAQNASPIELSLSPATLKVGPSQQALLNITAKFKNSYMVNEWERESHKQKGKEMFNHLLLGKVKDTNIYFSFVVQASIIDTIE